VVFSSHGIHLEHKYWWGCRQWSIFKLFYNYPVF